MNNVSFFDGQKQFKIDKPVRLIELFAGIGSQAKALKNLGVDFEHYRICEFDKYAVASYNAVHGTNFTTSDITKITADDLGIVDTDKYCYIMTYSFPCQDLSNAGLGKGMAKGSGTRSGLLWEVERLLDECKELPQVLLMENVPQVIGQKNIEHFAKWQEKLESLGYKNKWQVLNAKDFGIPQNRERCFMVSILGDYYYEFPKPMKLEKRLKDLLENEVDGKYYLSDKKHNNRVIELNLKQKLCNELIKSGKVKENDIIRHSYSNSRMSDWEKRSVEFNDMSPTLDTRCDCLGVVVKEETACKEIKIQSNVKVRKYKVDNAKLCELLRESKELLGLTNYRIASILQIPLTKVEHWFRQDSSFAIPDADIWFELKDVLDIETDEFDKAITEFEIKPNEFDMSNRAYLDTGCSPTLTATDSPKVAINEPIYIRKLTPKECWRLMGFDDSDIDKAIAVGISNAQLYKQAGNSIVVNVLMEIFKGVL